MISLSSSRRDGLRPRCLPLAGPAAVLASVLAGAPGAAAEEVQAAIEKANVYIEVAKTTERAVDSWERYASWVNMKTGPTGKERYITYGLYDLHDTEALLEEARAAAGKPPAVQKLDAAMTGYIAAYEALAPVMNEAAAYYERGGYEIDRAAKGQVLHKKMVPLATAFLAERDQLMPELRTFVREVERQEAAAIETKEGRSAAWQAAQVMVALNRVMDLFPRDRPQQIHGDEIERMISELGPDTPGEKFDELIMGVRPPQNTVIDVKAFNEALEAYGRAVETFEGYQGETPEDFAELKPLPREMLAMLRAFQEPLNKSGGREFDGGGQMVMRIAEVYFALMNASNPVSRGQVRYLP